MKLDKKEAFAKSLFKLENLMESTNDLFKQNQKFKDEIDRIKLNDFDTIALNFKGPNNKH